MDDYKWLINKGFAVLLALGGMTTFAVFTGQMASCAKHNADIEMIEMSLPKPPPKPCQDEIKRLSYPVSCSNGAPPDVKGEEVYCRCNAKP